MSVEFMKRLTFCKFGRPRNEKIINTTQRINVTTSAIKFFVTFIGIDNCR